MWQDGYRAPANASAAWESHHRFFRDLFSICCPTTLRDLTAGEAEAFMRHLQPTLRVIEQGPADLVVGDRQLPDPAELGPDSLVFVRQWDGHGDATRLPNGLAMVAGNSWDWLHSEPALRWLLAYGVDHSDAERDYLLSQNEELQEAIASAQRRIDVLEREVLTARDEVAQLMPLLVSPKAQLTALRRSVPISLRKRVPRRRQRPASVQVPAVDARLQRLKGVSLQNLLATHYDSQWAQVPLEQYLTSGLRTGAPVNLAHSGVIAPMRPNLADSGYDWGPVELVTADGRIRGQLPDLLENLNPELVSVDVWDTLIVRDRPADAAKLATARRIVLRPEVSRVHPEADVFDVMAARVETEAAAAASNPLQEYLLSDVIGATFAALGVPVGAATIDVLVEAEIADEVAWTRARPDVARLVEGQSVVIASDFYMTGEQLGRIVAAADPKWSEVPVYVSVEQGCSKRLGGGLLDLIRRDSGVSAARHVHVGDNVHSDVTMQVRAGGMAVQVQAHSRFPGPGEFGPDDLPACDAELQRRLRTYDAAHPIDDGYRTAGRSAGALAVAVVARGLEKAYRDGVDRVHYVSREGIFLARVHDVVEPLLRPPGALPVAPIHLALSRRATFGASLQAPYRFSLQRMWSMYAKQSPNAMLLSIGVDPQAFVAELEEVGLDLHTMVNDSRYDRRLESFLSNQAVEEKISRHVEQARDLLRRYVLSQTKLTSPFIVVDVGWRGTIQDNLVRALAIPSSFGVYFGLFPFLNAQPSGSEKVGVAFDGNLGEAFSFADPPAVLERPWTPDVPSTIGFSEQDGRVVPLHDKESGHVSQGIAGFQQGSLEVSPLVAQWMVGFGLTSTALRPQIARWAHDLWDRPPAGVADIWFSSDHDDSFGAFNVTDFGKDRPGEHWLQGDLYGHIRRGMADSGWPSGYRSWQPVASLIELGNLP